MVDWSILDKYTSQPSTGGFSASASNNIQLPEIISPHDTSSFKPQEENPYFYGQRGTIGDTFSNIGRGLLQGAKLSGYALDQAGIETGLEEWAASAEQKYTFLKPDIDEYYGNDSWLATSAKGALQSLPTTLMPMAAGAAVGNVAGAAAGFGVGVASLVGLFGMGTYNQTYRESVDKLGDEAASDLALKTAMSEVGSEGVSDIAAVATAGAFGLATNAIKSGVKTSLKGILSLGPANFLKAAGINTGAEVGSESLNAYFQTSEQIKAGLDPGMTPSEAAFAAIGPALFLSGGITLATQGLAASKRSQMVNALKSADTDAETRQNIAASIYTALEKKEGLEVATSWREVADHAIANTLPLNINTDFVAEATRLLKDKKQDSAAGAAEAMKDNAKGIVAAELERPWYEINDEIVDQYEGPELPSPITELFRSQLSKAQAEYDAYDPDAPGQQLTQEELLNRYNPDAPTSLGQSALIGGNDINWETPSRLDKERGEAAIQTYLYSPAPPATQQTATNQFIGNLRRNWQADTEELDRRRAAEPPVDPMTSPLPVYDAEAGTPPSRLTPEELKKRGQQLRAQDLKSKYQVLGISRRSEATLLHPDLPKIITETPLFPGKEDEFLNAVQSRINQTAPAAAPAEKETETAAPAPAPAATTTQPTSTKLTAPVKKATKPLTVHSLQELGRLVNERREAVEAGNASVTADGRRVDADKVTTRLSPEAAAEVAVIDERINKILSETDENPLKYLPELEAIPGAKIAPEHLQVAAAQDEEARAAFVQRVSQEAKSDPERQLAKAIINNDQKGISSVLSKYEFGSRLPALVNAFTKIKEAMFWDDQEDQDLLNHNAFMSVRDLARAALSNELLRYSRADRKRAGKRTVNPDINDGYLNWQKKGENLHTAVDPETGKIFALYKENNRWRILTGERTGDTSGGEQVREVTVFDPSEAGMKANQYVQQFYKMSGVKGVSKQLFSELNTEAAPNAYTTTRKDQASYYTTTDGQYYVVPRKDGNWGVMTKESFFSYKSLASNKAKGEAFLANKKGTKRFSREEALSFARSIAKAEPQAAAEKEAATAPKLTAKSDILEQHQENIRGAYLAEKLGKTNLEIQKEIDENPPSTPTIVPGSQKRKAELMAQRRADMLAEKLRPADQRRELPKIRGKALTKAEQEEIYRRDAEKAEADHTERQEKLLEIIQGVEEAFTKGNTAAIRAIRKKLLELFPIKKLTKQGKKAQAVAIIQDIDDLVAASMATSFNTLEADIAKVTKAISTSKNKQAQAGLWRRKRALLARRKMLVSYAQSYYRKAGVNSATPSEASVVERMHNVDISSPLDILNPPAKKRQPKKKEVIAQQKRSAEVLAELDEFLAESHAPSEEAEARYSVLNERAEELTKIANNALLRTRELEDSGGEKKWIDYYRRERAEAREERAEIVKRMRELEKLRPPTEPTAPVQPTKPEPPRIKANGPLFQYEGEDGIWHAESGHTITRGKNNRMVVTDPSGRQVGIYRGLLQVRADKALWRSFSAAKPRAAEAVIESGTAEEAEAAKAWKELQERKKADSGRKTAKQIEEEALATTPFHNWLQPQRNKSGAVQITSHSGKAWATLKVFEGQDGTGTTSHWEVNGLDIQHIAKFADLQELMSVLNGSTGQKIMRNKYLKYHQAKKLASGIKASTADGSNTALTDNTVDGVRRRLSKVLGNRKAYWANRLFVVQDISEVPAVGQEIRRRGTGPVLGYYNPHSHTITLVADRIAPGDEENVFLHEGVHFILDNDKTFKDSRADLLQEFSRLRNSSAAAKAAWEKAAGRNPHLHPESGDVMEEAYSYFMQDPANRDVSLWRKAVAAVKRWLISKGVPVSMLRLTEGDFAAMAARTIRNIDQIALADDLHKSFYLDGQHEPATPEGQARVAKFMEGSVIRTRDNEPLLLWATPGLEPTHFGMQFNLEGRGLGEAAEGSTGQLNGFYVNIKKPAVKSAAFMEVDDSAEAAAKKLQMVELEGADGVIVTRGTPQYRQNGSLDAEASGGIVGVVAFTRGQVMPSSSTYTSASTEHIKFSSASQQEGERSIPDEELARDYSIPTDRGKETYYQPVGPGTPQNKKGASRADKIVYNSTAKTFTLHSGFDPDADRYSSIRFLEPKEAVDTIQLWKEAEMAAAIEKGYADTGDTLLDKAADTGHKAKRLAKDLFQSISERLRRISHPVYAKLMEYEHRLHQRQKKYNEKARAFFEGYSEMGKEDRFLLDQALRNGDVVARDMLLKRNGLQSAWEGVDWVLDQIKADASEVGLIEKDVMNYFPRAVRASKLDNLRLALEGSMTAKRELKALEKRKDTMDPEEYQRRKEELKSAETEDFTVLGEEIRKAEEAYKRKTGAVMGSADRQALITRLLSGGHFQFIPRPGSSKLRSYEKVPAEHAQFYVDSAEALRNHIYEMSEAIEGRNLLGKTNLSRPTLMRRLRGKIKKMEALQAASEQRALAPQEVEAFDKLIIETDELHTKLMDINSDLDDSISAFILQEVEAGNIKDDPATGNSRTHEVIQLIKARLTQRGTSGVVGSLRDIGYMFTLGSPMSAITQIGDIAWSAYSNGVGNTAAALFKSLPAIFQGNSTLSREFFDFGHAMTDFSTNSTQFMLDKVLTYSGLKGMDMLGKEVFLQAALRRNKKMSREQFTTKWAPMFQGDKARAGKVHDKILAGEYGDSDVLFTLFNDLSQWQPITLSELPSAYNTAGNLRVFYMLKTFNIKALNNLHREITAGAQGSAADKAKAATKFVYLALLLSLAGAGSDEIKDWILDKDKEFSDHVTDNLVQLTLMNRYALEKGFNSGRIMSSVAEGLLPPMRFADYALDDLGKFMFDRENFKAKSVQLIPVVGRIIYSETEKGKESELTARKEALYRQIRKNAGGGVPLYGGNVRSMLASYNALARETGEKPLDYKRIKDVRKKELKRLREVL